MSENRTDTYQRITDQIIKSMEAGTRPWMQPWSEQNIGQFFARPLRANGEPYRGINTLLLWMASATHGFEHDRFMTYRQAQELGGQVRRGEQGTLIVKYGTITRTNPSSDGTSDDEERQIPFLKSYTVFNVSQIDGLPEEFRGRPQPQHGENRMALVDAFIARTQARIVHGGSRACYVPVLDLIRMPPFAAFSSPTSFYNTSLHELAHNAAIRIMPHGLRWRSVSLVSAMRLFGIIRALPGRQAGYRRAGTAPKAWPEPRRGQAPFPSFACRHGCRSGWSRRSRDQARAR
jgi:antirestriction protein ArdC